MNYEGGDYEVLVANGVDVWNNANERREGLHCNGVELSLLVRSVVDAHRRSDIAEPLHKERTMECEVGWSG